MTLVFRGGRLPNRPEVPRLKLSKYLGAVPVPAASADWLSAVPSWPMYLNDQIGDCTCAAVGHMIEGWTQYTAGAAVQVTDQDVLTAYEKVGGYNPSDPSTDNGAVIQDVLGYWQKTGVGGHKIVAFAEVDIANATEVRQAIELFGSIDIGINFPSAAMDQFNNRQEWTPVAGDTIEGGHCVPVGAYDASSYTCVTWGATQKMDLAFWSQYVEEAWVVITQDWVEKNGNVPSGLNLYQLGQDYAEMTGQANPIPAPTPTPAPTPAPEPWDKELVKAFKAFVTAFEAWMKKIGL